MRGKAPRVTVKQIFPRITPAYAGKRSTSSCQAGVPGDHPRVCGEKVPPARRGLKVTGSPPRMRGKADIDPEDPTHVGITPAYAGKSTYSYSVTACNRDHPRVCGEKTKKIP